MTASSSAAGLNITSTWFHRWICYLVSCFMFASAALRGILVLQNSPLLDQILPFLACWFFALMLNILSARRSGWFSIITISLEIFLTEYILLVTQIDFFAFLFAIPCMQTMQRFTQKSAMFLLSLSALLTFLTLYPSYGLLNTISTVVLFFGGSLFLVTYIGSTRRAQAIQEKQQELVGELKQDNNQLMFYFQQLQQLAAGRERQRLARELHDSVTQTIFSMTLTTQSALMLLGRDRRQVAALLDRLSQLNQNALTEMQVLISKLAPENLTENGFIVALQAHIAEWSRLNEMSVQLSTRGNQSLTPLEEQNLFRIAQESLNNIIKHAGVTRAEVRLHLDGQPCLEIEDQGVGFNPQQIQTDGRMGLANMQARAREIGWTLRVDSSPGNGTRIQVRKDKGG